jgi:hypothetical protein
VLGNLSRFSVPLVDLVRRVSVIEFATCIEHVNHINRKHERKVLWLKLTSRYEHFFIGTRCP